MHRIIHLQRICNRLATLLAGFVAFTALLYGALLLGAVAHTAEQTKAEREIGKFSAHMGGLEAEYFAIIRSITPERAQELGFTAPSQSTTVFATAASKALTLEGLSNL